MTADNEIARLELALDLAKEKRRKAIIAEKSRMSYGVLAERHGITRSQVAGIIWRHNNPKETRIYKNSKGGRSGGKCGRGHHGTGIYPQYTLANSR